jgi:CDP-glucose 4,6-dehydratase
MEDFGIYRNKRVLLTGHTGFKGAWLAIWLIKLGAEVIGFSLKDWDNDFVYRKTRLSKRMYAEIYGDLSNMRALEACFDMHSPEIVFHLAAQPIVRTSYDRPIETFQTNIMGVANVLECVRKSGSCTAAVIITTDKVYKNKESEEGYSEEDELGGHDPYSSSKACAEIVVESYRKSFLSGAGKLAASARAGNVIGGGDFAKDRLVPDCIRAINNGKPINVRNPHAVRPWQYVLEPLQGYLKLGKRLLENDPSAETFADCWNFGPDKELVISVERLVSELCAHFDGATWIDCSDPKEKKHETEMLLLNTLKAKKGLGFQPKYGFKKAVDATASWYKKCEKLDENELHSECIRQIDEYSEA